MILLELLPGEDKGMEQRKIEAKVQSLPIHQSCCGLSWRIPSPKTKSGGTGATEAFRTRVGEEDVRQPFGSLSECQSEYWSEMKRFKSISEEYTWSGVCL